MGLWLKTEYIRVIDHMWLVNLQEDNKVLYKNWMRWADFKHKEAVVQFQRVVRVCRELGIHSCADWKTMHFK